MKCRISLVIAFALSFLMMFSAIARAGEMKVQITLTLPESTELEVVKVPPIETNKSNYPLPQEKASDQVLKQEESVCKQSCGGTADGCAPGYYRRDDRLGTGYQCILCIF
jgi:hypothetical protein